MNPGHTSGKAPARARRSGTLSLGQQGATRTGGAQARAAGPAAAGRTAPGEPGADCQAERDHSAEQGQRAACRRNRRRHEVLTRTAGARRSIADHVEPRARRSCPRRSRTRRATGNGRNPGDRTGAGARGKGVAHCRPDETRRAVRRAAATAGGLSDTAGNYSDELAQSVVAD